MNPVSSAIYTEANADISLPHDFGISGAVGFVDDGSTPYTTWNAGLYYAPTDWATLDLRYSATNLSDSRLRFLHGRCRAPSATGGSC